MIRQERSTGSQTRRCAVCKIDLKGRFVFIDDEAEQLFGLTREELFGRPFTDFLAEADHEVIDNLLSRRAACETFFDAACINLMNKTGAVIPAGVIVSLNFIAGNPANFQFIINTEDIPEQKSVEPDPDTDYRQFVDDLLKLGGPTNLEGLEPLVAGFCMARRAILYGIDEQEPGLLRSLCEDSQADVASRGDLHRDVALTGDEYSFISEKSARRAVELQNSAPNEYIAVLDLKSEGCFLLRLVFADDISPADAAKSVTKAQWAANLVTQLFATNRGDATSCSIKQDSSPLIESLGKLGIGLLQIDSVGQITAYNSSLSSNCEGQGLSGHYDGFLGLLVEHNSPDLVRRIRVEVEVGLEGKAPELSEYSVKLPSGWVGQLAIAGHSAGSAERGVCFVFIPRSIPGTICLGLHPEVSSLVDITRNLQSSIAAVASMSDTVMHKHGNYLSERGRHSLKCLDRHVAEHSGMLGDLHALVETVGEIEDLEATDINLVVTRLIEELRDEYPTLTVTCQTGQLPKVAAFRRRLERILRNVLSNSFKYAQNDLHLRVNASEDGDMCTIDITDDGSGIAEEHCDRVFEFFCGPPIRTSVTPSGNGTSLAVTRQLVRSLGGNIKCVPHRDKGLSVLVTIPIARLKGEE